MSASNTDSAASVFLTDSDDEIRRKIMTHVSGGRETAKLQRELGADLDIDVAYQWLRFFLEDDEELRRDRQELRQRPGAILEPRPSRSASSSSCRSSCGRTRPGGTSGPAWKPTSASVTGCQRERHARSHRAGARR